MIDVSAQVGVRWNSVERQKDDDSMSPQLQMKQGIGLSDPTAADGQDEGEKMEPHIIDASQSPIASDANKVNKRIPKSLKVPNESPKNGNSDTDNAKIMLSITEMVNKQLQESNLSPPNNTALLGGTFNAASYLSSESWEGVSDPMAKFKFNQVASHNTPYNRPLRDIRNPL